MITMRDDGGSINLDKIRARALKMGLDESDLSTASNNDLLDIIFKPGFSTTDQVTDLSGRGVGMDVVRTNLRQVRGEVSADTQPGAGTTFIITVPFTLSIVRVLLVESEGMMLVPCRRCRRNATSQTRNGFVECWSRSPQLGRIHGLTDLPGSMATLASSSEKG